MKIICDHCDKTNELASLEGDSRCGFCGEPFQSIPKSCAKPRSINEYTGFLVTLIYFFAASFYFYQSLFQVESFKPVFQANILVFRLALGGFTIIGGYRFWLRLRRFI